MGKKLGNVDLEFRETAIIEVETHLEADKCSCTGKHVSFMESEVQRLVFVCGSFRLPTFQVNVMFINKKLRSMRPLFLLHQIYQFLLQGLLLETKMRPTHL